MQTAPSSIDWRIDLGADPQTEAVIYKEYAVDEVGFVRQ